MLTVDKVCNRALPTVALLMGIFVCMILQFYEFSKSGQLWALHHLLFPDLQMHTFTLTVSKGAGAGARVASTSLSFRPVSAQVRKLPRSMPACHMRQPLRQLCFFCTCRLSFPQACL